ncbi:hypothetical protein [Halomarina oriensis]|uniref:Trimeric autotransporter adhesin YadA-like head domain-containing protein n=1 Tax=Halomarina oriensis TaxID=671145 RepID=A0A6B0GDJ1_9EURY|nr:hypothetical protein [Halomarina oriensis]MWG32976.1 hypothetical protein [Halomarina oriensis]
MSLNGVTKVPDSGGGGGEHPIPFGEMADETNIALGPSSTATGTQALAQGYFSQSSGNYGVAYGARSRVDGQDGTALGRQAKVFSDSGTAVGGGAFVNDQWGVGLGFDTSVYGRQSIAIGAFAETNNTTRATAIGTGATANLSDVLTLGDGVNYVQQAQIAAPAAADSKTANGANMQNGMVTFEITDDGSALNVYVKQNDGDGFSSDDGTLLAGSIALTQP